jgi:enoyl-CoA hydratase
VRAGLRAAAARADGDDVSAVLLAGNERCFSAGGDIHELRGLTDPEAAGRAHAEYLELYRAWQAVEVPVVAALRGFVLGGALELALCCDLRIAHPDTFFCASAVRHGLVESAHSLPRVVGAAFAAEMLFTAREVSAAEALAHDLVNGLDADPEGAGLELARRIAAHPVEALRATKATQRLAGQAGTLLAGWQAVPRWRRLQAAMGGDVDDRGGATQ